MLIKAINSLDKKAPYSNTTVDINAGTTIPVKNISQYYASWAVQIGNTGEEKSEVRVLDSATPSGTAINLTSALSFDHPADTPVYAIKFDKIIFKRSTSGTAGTATAMSSGTVSIAPDFKYTIFDDTTGASSYAYKAQFYNSVTGEISQESDWLTSSGYTFYSKFNLRESIKNDLFSAKFVKDDTVIDGWANGWLSIMNNAAVEVNQDYNIGTVDIAFGTNGLGTITSADFKDIRKIDITTDGVNYFRAAKTSPIEVMPDDIFNATNPYFYMRGDSVIVVKNGGVAGTISMDYYKLNTILTADTDELPVVMRGYVQSFIDYGLSRAYYLDQKVALGDRFMSMAEQGKQNFILEISPRTKTGPRYIQLVESISGDGFYGL